MDVIRRAREQGVRIVDVEFTDLLGTWQHFSLPLEQLGEADAAGRVMRAVEAVCREGLLTRDLGGTARTGEVGDAVAARVAG